MLDAHILLKDAYTARVTLQTTCRRSIRMSVKEKSENHTFSLTFCIRKLFESILHKVCVLVLTRNLAMIKLFTFRHHGKFVHFNYSIRMVRAYLGHVFVSGWYMQYTF